MVQLGRFRANDVNTWTHTLRYTDTECVHWKAYSFANEIKNISIIFKLNPFLRIAYDLTFVDFNVEEFICITLKLKMLNTSVRLIDVLLYQRVQTCTHYVCVGEVREDKHTIWLGLSILTCIMQYNLYLLYMDHSHTVVLSSQPEAVSCSHICTIFQNKINQKKRNKWNHCVQLCMFIWIYFTG